MVVRGNKNESETKFGIITIMSLGEHDSSVPGTYVVPHITVSLYRGPVFYMTWDQPGRCDMVKISINITVDLLDCSQVRTAAFLLTFLCSGKQFVLKVGITNM